MKEKIQKVLVVHEKSKIASYISEKLAVWGCKVHVTSSGFSAMEKIGFYSYFAIFISSTLPLTDYRELIIRIVKEYPGIFVVVVDVDNKVEEKEMQASSGDFYLPDPMDDHLLSSVLYEMAGRRPDLEKFFENIPLVTFDFERMVGRAAPMMELYRILKKVSHSSVTVLIQGESGTGKELTARAIHYSGERKGCPFVAVSCAAIPENLLETELFGHEKGAFTGAVAQKIGKFEQAHKGTVFLDEIAEMSPSLQAKLLRVLEESEFQKVGGNEKIKVDVRIISATNKDLWKLTEKGLFRQDLYYRLSAFPILLPPLRERNSDIPVLVKHFIKKHHNRAGKEMCRMDSEAMDFLRKFNWLGNIRELENVIERSLVMCENSIIRAADLPEYIVHFQQKREEHVEHHESSDALLRLKPIEEIEKEAIMKALKHSQGNQSQAARYLKMNLLTFYRKIKKYDIHVEKVKESKTD